MELTIVRPLEYRLTPGSGSDDLMMDITPQTAIHFLFLFLKGAPDSRVFSQRLQSSAAVQILFFIF